MNDSAKPIEAFFLWQQCGTALGMSIHDTQRPVGSSFSPDIQDALSGGGDRVGVRGADGRNVKQDEVIAQGQRFITLTSLASDPESMKCELKIIAAVFTDGSFEGDDQALSSIQARRDGSASGVRYWMAKLNPQSGEMPEREAILADAESRSHADQQALQTIGGPVIKVVFTPAYNYWMGRSQVDDWVAGDLKDQLQRQDPTKALQSMARWLDHWQKKFDGDIAMKKLAAAFPLPDGIAQPDPQSAP
ncbi:MAG: hypothetical protein WCB58_22030 [Acidobacteriaceae bacterium]